MDEETSPERVEHTPELIEASREWEKALTAQVVESVRHYQAAMNISTARLARVCTDLGLPMKRTALASILGGRRQSITLQEVLVLAEALRVPPMYLLFPMHSGADSVVLLGRRVHPLSAADFVDGPRYGLDLLIKTGGPTNPDSKFLPEAVGREFLTNIQDLRDKLADAINYSTDSLEWQADRAAQGFSPDPRFTELITDYLKSSLKALRLLIQETRRISELAGSIGYTLPSVNLDVGKLEARLEMSPFPDWGLNVPQEIPVPVAPHFAIHNEKLIIVQPKNLDLPQAAEMVERARLAGKLLDTEGGKGGQTESADQ